MPLRHSGASTTEPLTCYFSRQDPRQGPSDSPAFTPLIPAALGPLLGHCRPALGPFEPWSESRRAGRVRRKAAIFLDHQPAEPSRRAESQTAWQCALTGTQMLASDGCASGWDNPSCHFFCAVWVPRRGGEVAVAMVRGGQLTDVRVARLDTRICV